MFVRTPEDITARGDDRLVADGRVRAMRYAKRNDRIGFSFSDVRVAAGETMELWYKNHWEANYVASGRVQVDDIERRRSWDLSAGAIYCVGPTDKHRLRMIDDTRIIAVFNPPLDGTETHDEDGAYPPTGPVPAGAPEMFVKTVADLREAGKELVVAGGSARSVRLLTSADNLGFTIADVALASGRSNVLWYKNHWEANFILGGEGEVTELASGRTWPLRDGTMYVVGPDDRHAMRAATDLHLVSIFCPALHGNEMHDSDGALPPSGPLPPGPC